jgi:aspartyl-tRNA synthetase
MERFGSDKPDLRFGLEIRDVSGIAVESEFKVFRGAVERGGSVRGIAVGDLGDLSRRELEELASVVALGGAKGLVDLKVGEDGLSGRTSKFFSDEEGEALRAAVGAEVGDYMFFVADADAVVFESLNRLRLRFRDRLGLADPGTLALCWVTDFPLFEWNEDEERVEPMHHMFTMPREEDLGLLDTDPLKVIGQLYDLVANGVELASGSIRIHLPELQQKVFSIVNIPPEEAERRFGAMLRAFRYGAPPHGGIAPGVDRLLMVLRDEPNIREVMAFPKTQNARDEMMDAPGPVTAEQLDELHITIKRPLARAPNNPAGGPASAQRGGEREMPDDKVYAFRRRGRLGVKARGAQRARAASHQEGGRRAGQGARQVAGRPVGDPQAGRNDQEERTSARTRTRRRVAIISSRPTKRTSPARANRARGSTRRGS